MKNLILAAAALSIAVFSSSAFAEKVVITGKPVVLDKQGEVYFLPKDYRVNPTYQFVVVDGKQRICYLDKKPDFMSLDVVSINVLVGTEKATWNCYLNDPVYFTVE